MAYNQMSDEGVSALDESLHANAGLKWSLGTDDYSGSEDE